MKKIKLFISIFLTISCQFVIISCSAQQTNFVWAKTMGASGTDNIGYSVVTDALGNVYTTGTFQGTVDFDPGAGIVNLISAGGNDVFISKLDASGNFVWAKSLGGTAAEYSTSIALDAGGNVYTIGYFYGTTDFDPSAVTYNLTMAGGCDIFVSKLDAAGNFVWAKAFNGVNIDTGLSLSVDVNGNVYTTGYFFGTVDFDPSATTSNLSSFGGTDVFICKLDANGNYIWAKKMGGSGGDAGTSIVCNGADVFLTGYFSGTADFDPSGTTYNLSSNGSTDIFISRLDASGNFIWAKVCGGPNSDNGSAIAVDASKNVYTTGVFSGTADLDPTAATINYTSIGSNDIFISKLTASGSFVWTNTFGGINGDNGNSIAVDASENVYTTGYFQGTTDFDPSIGGTYNLTSSGGQNIFISKLNTAGNFLWAKAIGAGTGINNGNSITIDAAENVYTAGSFQGTVDFNQEAEGVYNLTSAGITDVFIHKMSQCLSAPSSPVASNNGPICAGSQLNLMASTVSGASYSWSGPNGFVSSAKDTTVSINSTVAMAGTYAVTVTLGGCTSLPATTSVVINPTPATPTAENNGPVCEGSQLSLTSNTFTGNTYNWTGPNGFISSVEDTTVSSSATIVMAGTYSVTTTMTGCTSLPGTTTVVVNTIPVAPTAFSNSPVNAGSSLSLTASSIPGAAYNWTGPNGFSSSSQNPTLTGVTVADAGTYSVTATLNGCTSPVGTTSVAITTLNITTTKTNVSCHGGNNGAAAVVSVSGGTAPFSYSWNTSPIQSTQAIFNLVAGTYVVTVTDDNGYSATASVVITEPPVISVFTNPTDISCSGGNNGMAQAIAGGGTPPYTYSWNTYPIQNTATAANLSAGNYTVTVTDSNNCTNTKPIVINQPSPLDVTLSIINSDCGVNNGSITTTVTGGTSSYSYLWSNSATAFQISNLGSQTFSLTVTDAKGCTKNSIGTVGIIPANYNLAFSGTPQNAAAPLPATFTNTTPTMGNYNFTWYWGDGNSVIDNNVTVFYTYNYAGTYDVALVASNIANGCRDTLAKHPYINVTGTACGHSAAVSPTGPVNKCQGETLVLTANTNATAPFTYQWNIGSVTISGATGNTLAVTQSGYYSVTVIKAGCPVTSSAVQVNFSTNPVQPAISSTGAIIPCVGGSMTLTASTIAGVTYSWNTVPVQNTQSINVTSSGNYIVTVANGAGCTASSNPYTVNATLAQPSICMVTVDAASINNIIYWDKTAYTNADSFIVYREVSTSIYKRIGAVSLDSLSEFVDTSRSIGPANGNPNVGSYRYKLQVRDTCGNYSILSPYHNTIYIIDAGLGQFTWSIPYSIEGAANPVANYILLCDTANVDIWTPVGTVAGTQSSATDPGFSNHSTIANWRVKTAWSITCTPTKSSVNTTRSNIKHSSVVTGITAAHELDAIKIYPNPAHDFVSIELPELIQKADIRIMNSIGQLVYGQQVTLLGNAKTIKQINTSTFAKGIYTIVIETKNAKTYRKLVIN